MPQGLSRTIDPFPDGLPGAADSDFEAGEPAGPESQPSAEPAVVEDALRDLLQRIGSGEEQDPQGAVTRMNARIEASRGVDLGGVLQGLLGSTGQQSGAAAKPHGSGFSADLEPVLKRIAEALGVSPAVAANCCLRWEPPRGRQAQG